MKSLVVGYGSIGQRHARILNQLKTDTAVVSQRNVDYPKLYDSLSDAIECHQPEYIVIANKTRDHYNTLQQLLDKQWEGIVLVEKPLFHQETTWPVLRNLNVFTAYNLRFHPLIQRLREVVEKNRVISVLAYVGQYLPNWRPNQDYRTSYSAKAEEGGGVLRDLSHELDYLSWIFGKWSRLVSIGGKYSSLEINTHDSNSILLEMEKCPQVQLQMNYLDRIGRREIIVNTEDHTFKIDLINGFFQMDSDVEVLRTERDETYIAQHRAIVDRQWDDLCTYNEGIRVMDMIYAVEQSEKLQRWVWNE